MASVSEAKSLVLDRITHRFASGTMAVSDINLDVKGGEIIALLGPSGCGKTTLLRVIAGFIGQSEGRVIIGNDVVDALPPNRRAVGIVFQNYALFPHLSISENVGYGLAARGVDKATRAKEAQRLLDMVQLGPFGERLPRQLSGGQQQRVALARALVINPRIFLLDEPLSNLDAKLRAEVRLEIRALQQRLGLTTLMVTHDREEALTMADRLVVIEGGRVRQIGTPQQLYDSPVDAFVADFVGRCNILAGRRANEREFRTGGGLLLPVDVVSGEREDADAFALRPERIGIVPGDAGEVRGRVQAITYMGAQTEYVVALGDETLVAVRPTPDAGEPLAALKPDDTVSLQWDRKVPRLVPQTSK